MSRTAASRKVSAPNGVPPQREPDAAPGLRRDDFTRIAKNGFGDAYNGVAHSGTYFKDRLYIGTSRCNLHMIAVNSPPSTRVWPVKLPRNVYDLDRRAHIWRYDPQLQYVERVYRSPEIRGTDGTLVAQDIGYRGMAVFQGTTDASPALYVCTWSPSKGQAPQLLRTDDGEHFERLGSIGAGGDLASGGIMFNTFRTLYPFKNWLFTAPTGVTKGYGQARDCSAEALLWVTSDPRSQPWQLAAAPAFGDLTNLTVFEMVAFNDHLYVGTVNATSGYQVWKSRVEGDPPFHWEKVIDCGAHRGKLNEMAVSMNVFGNALYVGSGIQNGGYDKVHHIGPAGAELIRIHPDDSWDLIVGSPRHTPDGHKYPLADMGPGFESSFNAHMWRSCEHDGWFYVATYNWIVFLPYLSGDRWPQKLKRMLLKIGIDNLMKNTGGFDLWRTRDGVKWVPVTRNGFDNPYNYGVRQLLSTPHGLFVATANTFGPDIALRAASGEWTYAHNPSGGVELWLGTPKQPAASTPVPTLVEGTAPAPEHEGLSKQAIELKKEYDVRMYEPLVEEYYEGSDYYSWGYWEQDTHSQRQACDRMMEVLLARIPNKGGRILDVACGKGATTREVIKHYRPEKVVGVDISDKLMDTCRKNAPGCSFLVMDATQLQFPDESFENILCVDGAGLFDTREKFTREAWRVLKPGGYLVLSDRLVSREAIKRIRSINRENYVRDLDEYRDVYRRAGFEDIDIQDVTDRCLGGYSEHFSDFIIRKYMEKEIDQSQFNNFMSFILSRLVIMRYYVFVSARKPSY